MTATAGGAGTILRWQKPTTECWLNAEDVEDARAGACAADAFCLFATRQRKSWRIVRGDTCEGRGASLEVEEVERRHQVLAPVVEVA